MLQSRVEEEAKLSYTELSQLKRSWEAAIAVLSLFVVSDAMNREVVAARPGSQWGGTSEVARERREGKCGIYRGGRGSLYDWRQPKRLSSDAIEIFASFVSAAPSVMVLSRLFHSIIVQID